MLASLKTLLHTSSNVCKASFHKSAINNAKVAVILSGCGVYDGSEIHEASACLVHLSRAGADVSIFAPDVKQMHVIDHSLGMPDEQANRNVLQESARIARGNITALSELNASQFNGLVVPGGFGAAKNLSTFAVDGVDCNVNSDVTRVLKEFHASKKPIGLCCIAPILAAKVLPGCQVTVGHSTEDGGKWPFAGTAEAINSMGATHVNKDVTDIHVDSENNIVTTPAFMCDTDLHHVFDGIGKMIETVVKMADK